MAKNKSTVYLGFEDESITEKNKSLVNYTTNKVGGLPDWMTSEISVPNCPICSLSRPLILQIYAPLENSQFHRTMYVFACLNPTCSNLSRSWLCIRTQVLEKTQEIESPKSKSASSMNITWCSGANDWDEIEDNCNEENGNVIRNDNRISDDDDESNSFENEVIPGFGNLNVDDKNANCGAQGGAVGPASSACLYAEIEGEESEIVTVETPIIPERDLIGLLKQTSGIPNNVKSLTLKSFFVSVDEDRSSSSNQLVMNEHVRELLQEYQMRDETCRVSPDSPIAAVGLDGEQELYEKSVPAHGDVMFHNFLTTLQNNPGQLIRYSRDSSPVLISPLCEQVPRCQNCGSECICEFQILPTLIPKLKLESGEPAPIEYGNVLIFTCLKSCWDTPDKMRTETVIVQQEH